MIDKPPVDIDATDQEKYRSKIDTTINSGEEEDQQRKIFCSLPLEKMDALKPFARQLTADGRAIKKNKFK